MRNPRMIKDNNFSFSFRRGNFPLILKMIMIIIIIVNVKFEFASGSERENKWFTDILLMNKSFF